LRLKALKSTAQEGVLRNGQPFPKPCKGVIRVAVLTFSIILWDYALAGPGVFLALPHRALPCAVDRKAFSLNAAIFFLSKTQVNN
jgi:hypothetical protein